MQDTYLSPGWGKNPRFTIQSSNVVGFPSFHKKDRINARHVRVTWIYLHVPSGLIILLFPRNGCEATDEIHLFGYYAL